MPSALIVQWMVSRGSTLCQKDNNMPNETIVDFESSFAEMTFGNSLIQEYPTNIFLWLLHNNVYNIF